MFSYCGNSPIDRLDVYGTRHLATADGSGRKPLPYKSASEAAAAWSSKNYAVSLYIRREALANVYSISSGGITTYNYSETIWGDPHSVPYKDNSPERTTRVATVHTHPNSTSVSGPDIDLAEKYSLDSYVIGPDYVMLKYDISMGISVTEAYISVTPLAVPQQEILKYLYQGWWNAHIQSGDCEFNCARKPWPTP